MSSWQCKKRFGDSFSSHGTLCAGSAPDGADPGADSCQGAAGAGLLCQDEAGRWVLAGVLAGVHGCGDPSAATLYTRVGRFRAWTDEVTGTGAAGEPTGVRQHQPARWDGEAASEQRGGGTDGELDHAHSNDIIHFSEARRPPADRHSGPHARPAHHHQDTRL